MIPEDHKSQIISAGIEFLRSITEAYGAEEGMTLWDAIANTLDPDVKGQIFFALLCGEGGDVIHIKSFKPDFQSHQAVPIIKSIRTATGLGLREAKDLYDAVRDGKPAKFKVLSGERTRFVNELRSLGCIV